MTPEQSWEQIQKCTSYRELLKTYLLVFDYSLSDLARATGFGRGFPGDIISGKRRLTSKSSFAFEKALKIPTPGKRFFRLLVAKEENDLYPEIDRTRIAFELEQLRSKSWKRVRRSVHEVTTPRFKNQVLDKKALATYAASGSAGVGATLSEIQERTGFSTEEVLKYARELEKLQLFQFKTESHVVPLDQHFFLQTTDQSELLAHTFRQSAKLAVEKLLSESDKKNEFFFNSSFCVRADKMAEFKKDLRETVLKFVDNSTDDDGTRVVHLLTALHL
jgi:hypothetical protein